MSINWQDELQHSTGEIFEPDEMQCSRCGGFAETCICYREEESQSEMDLRCSGTFADSQARLARAINDLTEYVFVAPKRQEKL